MLRQDRETRQAYSLKVDKRRYSEGFQSADLIILFKKKYAIVNVEDLAQFEEGTKVDGEKLIEVGLIKKLLDGVKILGDGEIKHPMTIVASKFTKVAVEKIKAAGGEVKIIS